MNQSFSIILFLRSCQSRNYFGILIKKNGNNFDLRFIRYTFAPGFEQVIKSNLLIYLHLHDRNDKRQPGTQGRRSE